MKTTVHAWSQRKIGVHLNIIREVPKLIRHTWNVSFDWLMLLENNNYQ